MAGLMAEPARHLRLVDVDSGEVISDGCPQCVVLEDQLKGAERDLNAWRARYRELMRDKEAEARRDPLWPEATRLFQLYCRLTGGPGEPRRLTWGFERFELVRPHLKKHGPELVARAIAGRVHDHFSAKRKNGTTIHYHEWERIFKTAAEFEESANRAPRDWRRVVGLEAA